MAVTKRKGRLVLLCFILMACMAQAQDTVPPVVTCPNITTEKVEPSEPDAAVVWSPLPSATDNVDPPSPVVTCKDESDTVVVSGDRFPAGVNTITCSATDDAGNEGNCIFTITVTDNEAPIVSCPYDTSQNVDPSQPDAAVDWSPAPSATDVVGPPNPNVTCKDENDEEKVSGDTFPVGVNTITCSATDDAGNEGNCTFTITVTDTEPPILTCSNDIIQKPDPGSSTAMVTWDPPPTANDVVDGAIDPISISCEDGNGTIVTSEGNYTVGVTTVTCRATDSSSNEGNCSFSITIDDESPMVTCPDNSTQSVDSSRPDAAVDWFPAPTADDNVDKLGSANVTCRNDGDTEVSSGDRFPAGVNTITCSATDTAGNEGNCAFTITVEDNEPPILTCSNDTIENADFGLPTAVVDWDPLPTAIDVVDGVIAPVICEDGSGTVVTSGGTYTVGVTAITCRATDSSSNKGTCSFSITVVDTEDPVVTCPGDIEQNVEPSQSDAAVNWTVSVTDNADTDLGPSDVTCRNDIDIEVSSGDRFPAGVNTITCSATDTAGNEGNCTFTITVKDNEAPMITCPNDRSVNVAKGKSTASVTWVSTANDAVDGKLDTSCEPQQGTEFATTTVVTCTAGDVAGNNASCNFTITVTVDGESCPGNPVASCNCDDNVQNCVCEAGQSGPNCLDDDGELCIPASPGPNCNCTVTPCKCNPGFKGVLCNDCKGCMNGGSFQEIENCQCQCPSEGFDDPICSGCQECVNGGNQNENTCVCKCPGLFEGDLCDVCQARCENGGTLDEATCTCDCPSPFTGPTCSDCLPCVKNNINEGTDQNATTCACDCLEGFLPPLCAECMGCQNGGQYQNEATCGCECPGLYTGLLCTVCPSGDPCENGGKMDRGACSCECTDGWMGINCGEPVPTLPDDEYPDPPAGVDIEKKVSIEIEVTDNKNCEPALNISSKACVDLQKEFVAGVEIEYKRVAGFKKVEVTDLRNGSVIFQHQAIYDYAKMSPSQRGISALDLYRATVAQAVEAGQLGDLPVATECSTCKAPQDETDTCATDPPPCDTGLVIDKVTESNSCYYVCRASCKVEADYCNGGTCTQDSDGVKSCSCPQSTEFMYIGANCQLAVNLLWLYIGCGLGGGLLLLLLFTLTCCVVQYRKKVKQFESEDEEGTQEGDMRGEVRAVHHNNKGYVGDSSSVADEHPEGETQAPEQVRPYSYIYRNGGGVGVSRSSSGAAAVKNRYEPTVARDREQGTSSDQAEESGGKTRGSYFWGNLNEPVKEENEMIPMTSEIDPTKMQYKIQRPQVSVNRNDDLPERDYF